MKDLFENKLTSLIFGLFNGWDNTFAGYVIPTGINEQINNSFWMYLFNFLMLLESFSPKYSLDFNITSNFIN